MKRLVVVAAVAILALLSRAPAFADGLQKEVDQAVSVLEDFRKMPEKGIPESILRDAKGLAFLTVLKAGFMFSGQGGWGIVVAKNDKGWSGPSGIGTGGAEAKQQLLDLERATD